MPPDGVDASDGDCQEWLGWAAGDADVVARWRAKLVEVPSSGCLWWTGAISGRGHGRFWVARGRVVIAHRFAFAVEHGPDAVAGVAVLGHRCDNPLCQRVGDGHVVASSWSANRREWAARRGLAGGPLTDQRGARGRARVLRDLARTDPVLAAAELSRLRGLGVQLALW